MGDKVTFLMHVCRCAVNGTVYLLHCTSFPQSTVTTHMHENQLFQQSFYILKELSLSLSLFAGTFFFGKYIFRQDWGECNTPSNE